VTLLALARPDLSVSNDPISEYVHGPHSYVQIAVFFTVGVSSLALARGAWLTSAGRRTRSAALLVALWGVGMLLGGIIDVEDQIWRTDQGVVHNVVVKIAFLAVGGAMALVVRWRRRPAAEGPRERWLPRLDSPRWLALTTVALTTAAVLQGGRWFGMAQRVLAGSVVAWLVCAGLHLFDARPAAEGLSARAHPWSDASPLAGMEAPRRQPAPSRRPRP